MKETKDLYGRLMVLAWSSKEVDQKHAVGNYELTLTPRALFSPSGSLLPCSDKSKLIHALEKLAATERQCNDPLHLESEMSHTQDEEMDTTGDDTPHRKHNIAVVDRMVLVQQLTKKPATMVTVNDLSKCFNDGLQDLTRNHDEIVLVF